MSTAGLRKTKTIAPETLSFKLLPRKRIRSGNQSTNNVYRHIGKVWFAGCGLSSGSETNDEEKISTCKTSVRVKLYTVISWRRECMPFSVLCFSLSAVLFCLFLTLLTIAFVSAATRSNPNDYSSGYWPLLCEIPCFLYLFVSTVMFTPTVIQPLRRLLYCGKPRSTPTTCHESSSTCYRKTIKILKTIGQRMSDFVGTEPYLLLKFASFSFLWSYVVLRILNVQEQWHVAAVAYLATFLLIFKYTATIRFDGSILHWPSIKSWNCLLWQGLWTLHSNSVHSYHAWYFPFCIAVRHFRTCLLWSSLYVSTSRSNCGVQQ